MSDEQPRFPGGVKKLEGGILSVKRLVLSILFATLAGMPAMAGSRTAAVVELFTSQGCSSCPVADKYLGELARREGVVALAWHVDYWDYLGWRDTLGAPASTERQEAYRRALGNSSKYTPQMIINGRSDVAGSHRTEVEKRIAALPDALPVPVSMKNHDGALMIDIGAGAPADANVMLVCYEPPRTVSVARGENSGRKITYWNAVTSAQTAGMWHGSASTIELPLSSLHVSAGGGCAVLVQDMVAKGMPGRVLGAASLTFDTTGALTRP